MGKPRRHRQKQRRFAGLEQPSRQHSGAKRKYEFGWKSVTISQNTSNDKEGPSLDNHYDSPRLSKLASTELDGTPHEAPGIFFGLEVLDGDSYRVEQDPVTHQKIMVPSDEPPQTSAKAGASIQHEPPASKDGAVEKSESLTGEDAPAETKKNAPSKKRKRNVEGRDGNVKDNSASEEKVTNASIQTAAKNTEAGMTKSQKKKLKRKKTKEKAEEKKDESTANAKSIVSSDEGDNDENDATAKEAPQNKQEIISIQTSWSAQTGGLSLHPRLCESLLKQNFWSPTPIQASSLPAAVLGRRNIVGAAPTGSGKTLAFLLPIGQNLLEKEQSRGGGNNNNSDRRLQALILTPTRELALQIQAESDKLLGKGMTGSLVGGLAHAKQIRVLEKKRPPILVATPGRLWEMMSSREHQHLNDLSQIRFLVIDEADRMIQQGSFPQLVQILDSVQRANPMDDDDSDDEALEDDEDDEVDDADRLMGLPGVPGEAKLVMLNDDIMAEISRQRGDGTEEDKLEPQVREIDDHEFETERTNVRLDSDDESEISLPPLPPVHRQTFVYSATLTLPASSNFSKRNAGGKKGSRYDAGVDGAIAEILEKSRAKGKTKIVDLSNISHKKELKKNLQSEEPASLSAEKFRLPEGLSLQQIKCTQRHKDSHLYAYLMTTAEGSSGPCLVFCNSIAGVRRVGSTLQALGLDVRILHAQMQQRARFKAVELLQESKRRTVVIATDVAARGLDIPSVASVVHYDTARTVDAFVHRSGRTARGVGEKAVGCSVSLVASDEDKMHSGIIRSLQASFETVTLDGRLLHESQERVNLATKVAEVENLERKSQRKNQWLKEKAEDAGFEIDEDLLDEGLSKGDRRDRAKLMEAHRARDRLAELLTQPMRTQRFGKFLSTNSAYKQDVSLQTQPKPVAAGRSKKRRRRR